MSDRGRRAGARAVVALLMVAALAGCEGGRVDRVTSAPAESAPAVPTRPTLVSPVNGVTLAQNRADIGCPFSPEYGYGLQVVFEWTPSRSGPAIDGYEIYAKNVGAENPVLNSFVRSLAGSTRYVQTSCGTYITDRNLDGWEWRVRARDVAGNVSEWSEVGTYRFAPCRIDGRVCIAR